MHEGMTMKGQCPWVETGVELEAALRGKDRIVALFYVSWCPFCVRFLPVFQRHIDETLDFLIVQDDQERLLERYTVKVVPTVLLFEKGKVSRRLDGAPGVGLDEGQLAAFIAACRTPKR